MQNRNQEDLDAYLNDEIARHAELTCIKHFKLSKYDSCRKAYMREEITILDSGDYVINGHFMIYNRSIKYQQPRYGKNTRAFQCCGDEEFYDELICKICGGKFWYGNWCFYNKNSLPFASIHLKVCSNECFSIYQLSPDQDLVEFLLLKER